MITDLQNIFWVKNVHFSIPSQQSLKNPIRLLRTRITKAASGGIFREYLKNREIWRPPHGLVNFVSLGIPDDSTALFLLHDRSIPTQQQLTPIEKYLDPFTFITQQRERDAQIETPQPDGILVLGT